MEEEHGYFVDGVYVLPTPEGHDRRRPTRGTITTSLRDYPLMKPDVFVTPPPAYTPAPEETIRVGEIRIPQMPVLRNYSQLEPQRRIYHPPYQPPVPKIKQSAKVPLHTSLRPREY